MARPSSFSFAHFVPVPENRSALLAVQEVIRCLATRLHHQAPNPLFLHGPPGSGKTHLTTALVDEATRPSLGLVVTVFSAADLNGVARDSYHQSPARLAGPTGLRDADTENEETDSLHAARDCDLLVCEDVQHLSAAGGAILVSLIDYLQSRQAQMVFTANCGPNRLAVPARLASRLASGLVVAIDRLGPPSRLALLQAKAQRCQLAIHPEVLTWLADNLPGTGRQLEGALVRLETLSRTERCTLSLELVTKHFRAQTEASRPTVEQIAKKIGSHFHVDLGNLKSGKRSRSFLLPRQISMYLARQLTGMSLQQIGTFFGGRDHSTVLHACRKMEHALNHDPALTGTIRQLQMELT